MAKRQVRWSFLNGGWAVYKPGSFGDEWGPYRWRWVARLVAYFS